MFWEVQTLVRECERREMMKLVADRGEVSTHKLKCVYVFFFIQIHLRVLTLSCQSSLSSIPDLEKIEIRVLMGNGKARKFEQKASFCLWKALIFLCGDEERWKLWDC